MNEKSKNKVLIYMRSSLKNEITADKSIEAQEVKCRNYIYNNDFKVAETFIDNGFSATNMQRPGLNQMFNYIKDNFESISCIIVSNLDRLTKSKQDYKQYIKPVLSEFDIELLSTEAKDMDYLILQ